MNTDQKNIFFKIYFLHQYLLTFLNKYYVFDYISILLLTCGPGFPAIPRGPGDPASPFAPSSPVSPLTPG